MLRLLSRSVCSRSDYYYHYHYHYHPIAKAVLLRKINNPQVIITQTTTRFYSQDTKPTDTDDHHHPPRVEGKVALITGGASGLGKAMAKEFIKHGARVVIADINDELGPQIVSNELGPQAHFVPCDVACEAHISEAVNFTMARHGKIDIMCNNAGISGSPHPPSIVDLDLNEFDLVMRVNVRGIITGIKHAARVMIPAGTGSILCTASISGLMGGLGPHPYTISKFAIPGMVKSLASELCKHGIRINCISPAAIATPLVINQFAQIFPSATTSQIIGIINGLVGEDLLKGAICEDVDVARAALYLVSDEAKYVTGHNLVVDGGFTCFKNPSLPVVHPP